MIIMRTRCAQAKIGQLEEARLTFDIAKNEAGEIKDKWVMAGVAKKQVEAGFGQDARVSLGDA
jgi:hypothetical protein